MSISCKIAIGFAALGLAAGCIPEVRYEKDGKESTVRGSPPSKAQEVSLAGLAGGRYVAAFMRNDSDVAVEVYEAGGNTFVQTRVVRNAKKPAAAALTGGRFVVAYQSLIPDTDIFVTLYSPVGMEIVRNVRVNVHTSDYQELPYVAGLEDGGFVVVWMSYGQAGEGMMNDVYARRFSSEGAAVGEELHVNTNTESDQSSPQCTGLQGGGFVVVWESFHSGSPEVYAQVFGPQGQKVGAELLVSAEGSSGLPTVASTADGFTVFWEVFDGEGRHIYGRAYLTNGTSAGAAFVVTPATGGAEPSAAALADGTIAVAWQTNQDAVEGRVVSSLGTDRSGVLRVSTGARMLQSEVAVCGLARGGLAVAWQGFPADDEQDAGRGAADAVEGVVVQRYSAVPTAHSPREVRARGFNFAVNRFVTAGDQQDVDATALDNGYSLAVFSNSRDGGIYARVYNRAGAALRLTDQQVSDADTQEARALPAAAFLTSGRVVVTWAAAGRVVGRLYTRRRYSLSPVGAELPLTPADGTSTAHRVAALPGGGFVLAYSKPASGGVALVVAVYTQDGVLLARRELLGSEWERTVALTVLEGASDEFAASLGRRVFHCAVAGGELTTSLIFESQLNYVADMAPSGPSSLVVVFTGGLLQRLSAAGSPLGPMLAFRTGSGARQERVAALRNMDSFVVVWAEGSSDDLDVYMQPFDVLSCALVGAPVRVNTVTDGIFESQALQERPVVVALPGGRFTVFWQSMYQGIDDAAGVFGQRYQMD